MRASISFFAFCVLALLQLRDHCSMRLPHMSWSLTSALFSAARLNLASRSEMYFSCVVFNDSNSARRSVIWLRVRSNWLRCF